MAWDLATAYNRTGLPQDPATDILLQSYMDASLGLVEHWLNRKLEHATDIEAFPMAYSPHTVTLRRYPLTAINRVAHKAEQTPYPPHAGEGADYNAKHVLHADTGLLYFHAPVAKDELIVEYEGGYSVFPADLELALWLVFDRVYAAGSGAGGVSVGDISSITVPDVGTVRFATGDTSSSGSSGSGDGSDAIPATALALLRPYIRKTV